MATHTPRQARGFSLLEVSSTHWRAGLCPYNTPPSHLIERTDQGSTYYKNFFYGKGEQNSADYALRIICRGSWT